MLFTENKLSDERTCIKKEKKQMQETQNRTDITLKER